MSTPLESSKPPLPVTAMPRQHSFDCHSNTFAYQTSFVPCGEYFAYKPVHEAVALLSQLTMMHLSFSSFQFSLRATLYLKKQPPTLSTLEKGQLLVCRGMLWTGNLLALLP